MLGMLFTEALDFIEAQVGPVALEEIVEKAKVRSDAAYTAVGDYPHEDLIRIIEATAAVTRLPAMLGGVAILAEDWRRVHFTSAWRLLASAAAGIPLGVWGLTRLPAEELMRAFGSHVFARLIDAHEHARALADKGMRPFLFGVQKEIHDALTPLYDTADPPVVLAEENNGRLVITYRSHRPFAAVAHGLLEGCCAYFGEDYEVRANPVAGSSGHAASFELLMPESGGK